MPEHQVNAHVFLNRQEGAQYLCAKLNQYRDRKDTIIIGISRGGIIPACCLAIALNLDWDVIAVRRIMSPDNPELGLGSVCEDGIPYIDDRLVKILEIIPGSLDVKIQSEVIESKRKADLYREGKKLTDIENKIVLLVDDGVMTGSSAKAALGYLKCFNPKEINLVVPVIPPNVLNDFETKFDKVIYVESPDDFTDLTQFYDDFHVVKDQEVIRLLNRYKDNQVECTPGAVP